MKDDQNDAQKRDTYISSRGKATRAPIRSKSLSFIGVSFRIFELYNRYLFSHLYCTIVESTDD
jgi:hypothetical protein